MSSSIAARSSMLGSLHQEPGDRPEPCELRHRLGMVVDPQVDPAVVAAAVAAARPNDEQRRRLPATPVAAGGIARGQRRDEPVRQRARAPRGTPPASRRRPRGRPGCCPGPPRRPRSGRRPRRGRPRRYASPRRPAASTIPACRVPRSGSAATRRARASARRDPGCEERQARRARTPTFADACVATAPTPARALGTTEPTARNFDATAIPRSPVEASRATIENVIALRSAARAGRAGRSRRR